MPRRSGGGMSSSRARSPMRNVPARTAPPPAPVAAPPAVMAQPRQPGLFAQMATTAAGVAVGSAVGHTIGAAMTGSGGGHQEQPVASQQQSPVPAYGQQYYPQPQMVEGGPCQLQMKQFLECAQSQHDITLCQGFNDALRECKLSYGLSV